MSSYIIAGSANNPETAECEYLADSIQTINSNVDIRTIIKHEKDWDTYIDDICRTYGFKHKDNPIIFQTNGQLIGNSKDFYLFAEKNFSISLDMIDTKQRNEIINLKQSQKQYQKTLKQTSRKRTLKEKIHDTLYSLLESQSLQQLSPNYIQLEQNGLIFFTKQETKLQVEYPLKLIEEPPNIEKNIKEEEVFINMEEMYKKDYYENPEDGMRNLKIDEDEEKQQTNVQGKKGKKARDKEKEKEKEVVQEVVQEKKEQEQVEEAKEGEQQSLQEQQLQEQEQIPLEEEQKEGEEEKEEQGIEQMLDSPMVEKKEVIDTTPERIPMKKYIVKRLKDGYYIALHPDPLINGQCILFEDIGEEPQENQETFDQLVGAEQNEQQQMDQKDKEIYLSDYSNKGRMRKSRWQLDKPGINSNVVSTELKQQSYKSNLNNFYFNIFNPLSLTDLDKCCDVLRLLKDGYIVYQLLPEEGRSPFKALSNIINIFEKNALNKARLNESYFAGIDEKALKHYELPFEKYIMDEGMVIKEFEYKKEKQDKEGKGKKEHKVVNVKFQENPLLPKPHLIASHNCTGKNIQKLIFQMILYFKGSIPHTICQTGYNILLTTKKLYLGLLQSPLQIPPPFQLYLPPLTTLGFLHFPIAGDFNSKSQEYTLLQKQMIKQDIQPATEQEIEEQKARLPQLKYQIQKKEREKELKQMLNTFPKEEKPKFKVRDVVVS